LFVADLYLDLEPTDLELAIAGLVTSLV